MRRRIASASALGVAMFAICGVSGPPARAAYLVTLSQEGPNVVATGSGTIDLAGLSFDYVLPLLSSINPSFPEITTGATGDIAAYKNVTAPTNFGSGGSVLASSGSGDIVAASHAVIAVPDGYVSGSLLSDSAIYDDATLASLGVRRGVYVWTWGSGADADSFTLRAGAIPEPSTWALLGLGFLGLAGAGLRARAKPRAGANASLAANSEIAVASGH
jgi:PEP-CTERM motif-containing protein